MTEPLSPTPPAPEPRPSRHMVRWIVAALSILLMLALAGTAYGLHRMGDIRAADHREAIAEWEPKNGAARAAAATLNTRLWNLGNKFDGTPLDASDTACSRVGHVREATADNAAALPTLPDGFLERLSSSYEKAVKSSAVREKAVKAYAKSADQALGQIHTDCLWNLRLTTSDSGSAKYWDEADNLSREAEPGYYCPSKAGCVPVNEPNRLKFAALLLKAGKMDHDLLMKSFMPKTCEATSLGTLCGALKKSWTDHWHDQVDYAETAEGNGDVNAVVTENEKRSESRTKKFEERVFASHPALRNDERVSKRGVDTPDEFFDAMTRAALAGLKELGDAIPGARSADPSGTDLQAARAGHLRKVPGS